MARAKLLRLDRGKASISASASPERPRASPGEIADQIARCVDEFGAFEHASLQVNFNTMPLAEAQRSMRPSPVP